MKGDATPQPAPEARRARQRCFLVGRANKAGTSLVVLEASRQQPFPGPWRVEAITAA